MPPLKIIFDKSNNKIAAVTKENTENVFNWSKCLHATLDYMKV
jgi:hypothetical protein